MPKATCPACAKSYRVDHPEPGKWVRCKCGIRFDSVSGLPEGMRQDDGIDLESLAMAEINSQFQFDESSPDSQAPYALNVGSATKKRSLNDHWAIVVIQSAIHAFFWVMYYLLFAVGIVVAVVAVLFLVGVAFEISPFFAALFLVIMLGVFAGISLARLGSK